MAPLAPILSADAGGIAGAIQLAVAPVFLLAGIGAFLNVMTQRLARVIDRGRDLEAGLLGGRDLDADRHRRELVALSRRMTLVNAAITACAAAALSICAVVACLFLGALFGLAAGGAVAALFVGAMAMLMLGLALLLVEISVAMRSVRIRAEVLAADDPLHRADP